MYFMQTTQSVGDVNFAESLGSLLPTELFVVYTTFVGYISGDNYCDYGAKSMQLYGGIVVFCFAAAIAQFFGIG